MTNKTAERVARPSEFELIAELFAPLAAKAPGAFGLSDDCAILTPPHGHDVVLNTDAIVEGVHFFRSDPPASVGQKALRVNLSDLAAKGSVPVGYLMALMLPEWTDGQWLRGFADGLAADQSEFDLPLLGGDTTATAGPLSIAITAFGLVPTGAMIRRAGAKPGDLVFVSGNIGDAGGGLDVVSQRKSLEAYPALVRRYRMPTPRLALGAALRGVVSAALDVSDGLLADLEHLCDASHVGIAIDAARVPLSRELLSLWGDSVETRIRAATAGDDYEIAFAVPPTRREDALAAARRGGVDVHEIGRVTAGKGVTVLDAASAALSVKRKGFTHF